MEVVTIIVHWIVLELIYWNYVTCIKLIVFHVWQKDKKFCIVIQFNSTIKEFVNEICKLAKFLCEHHYIKNSPATYLEHCKSALPKDNAFILLDFAENYSFIVQDVFQGCLWNSQATLHLVIIYEKIKKILLMKVFVSHET